MLIVANSSWPVVQGKTFTTLWIKEALASKRTLVLVPSLSLLSQTLREWTYAANQPFAVLCVCSDETVVKRNEDEVIHSVSELAFPTTSNTQEIKSFMEKDGAMVIFSTYQSSPLVADIQADPSIPVFDLVIADEAHRCTGKVSTAFSTVRDGNRIKAGKRLFATATPRTYTASVKKAAEARDIEVVGMDDEAVFGKVFYHLSFGDAIRQDLLTDYRIVIIGVDDPMIAEWIKNRELIKTDSGIENDAESLASQIGLLKAIKDFDLRRVISFHSRVSRAESFKHDLPQVLNWIDDEHRPYGELCADFVSGEMPANKRRQKLSRLKNLGRNERFLLTNAQCLSEGIDVPSLDGVAFINPRSSQVDIIQAIGRAIRLSKDKKFGTIVLPVFIAKGDNAVASIEASNFKPVWDVLNAFRAHDEEFAQQLDTIRTGLGRTQGTTVSSQSLPKLTIDLPASIDGSFGNSLSTYLVEQTTSPWNFWFGLLEDHVSQFGTAKVKDKFVTSVGFKLGAWVQNQRQHKAKGVLRGDRIEQLEKLPGWTWDVLTEQWEEGFQQLQRYLTLFGNARVPGGYVAIDGYKLGGWTKKQRAKKAEKRLSQDQINRLEALLGWSWDPFSEQWEEGFQQLQAFVKQHGNARVRQTYVTTEGYNLGKWTTQQRQKKSKNSLNNEQIDRLEALPNWTWDPLAEQWEEGFEKLQAYLKRASNSKVKAKDPSSSDSMNQRWISKQRQNKSKNILDQGQIERLEALPGWSWDPYPDKWEEGFRRLQAYVDQHGDARVLCGYATYDDYRLGTWVSHQRKSKFKNRLSQSQIERLEALPGWSWEPYAEQWEEAFEKLKTYVKQYCNAMVKEAYVTADGFKLGMWVGNQRQKKSKSRLSQDRVERLEALPGWIWSSKPERK